MPPTSDSGEGVAGSHGVEEGVAVLPRLEATVRGQGIDYVRNDPDGGRMRLDAGVVVEDDEGNVSLGGLPIYWLGKAGC